MLWIALLHYISLGPFPLLPFLLQYILNIQGERQQGGYTRQLIQLCEKESGGQQDEMSAQRRRDDQADELTLPALVH